MGVCVPVCGCVGVQCVCACVCGEEGVLLGLCVVFTVGNQVVCRWTKEPNTPDTRWNVSNVNG